MIYAQTMYTHPFETCISITDEPSPSRISTQTHELVEGQPGELCDNTKTIIR
jgi:hypothetical protein